MYINKAIIIGKITKDIELKSLPSGTSVASFSVATNESYKDKDGNKQEKAEFHNIVVFGKQAENVSHYMKKGSEIYVEGKIQTRSWEQDGVKKYRTEIVANNIQFGYSPKNESQSNTEQATPSDEPIEYPEDDINPEDIPF